MPKVNSLSAARRPKSPTAEKMCSRKPTMPGRPFLTEKPAVSTGIHGVGTVGLVDGRLMEVVRGGAPSQQRLVV